MANSKRSEKRKIEDFNDMNVPVLIPHPLRFRLEQHRGRASTGIFSKNSRENTFAHLKQFDSGSIDDFDKRRLSSNSFDRNDGALAIGRTSSLLE